MAQNDLSQNELFQLMGNYPVLPNLDTEPVGKGLSAQAQLFVLKRNIRKCGIVKTAESWKDYSDPFLRSALKLAASGLDTDQVRSLLGASALAGDKSKLKEQLLFNNRLLSILFCSPKKEEV